MVEDKSISQAEDLNYDLPLDDVNKEVPAHETASEK